MEEKRKASELLPQQWQEQFFAKLKERKFGKVLYVKAKREMQHDERKGIMPPEYKNRPHGQGAQQRFRRYNQQTKRTIDVLTSLSIDGNKKVGYSVWIRMRGQSLKSDFVSSAVLDTPSLFDIALRWVDAFIDIDEHWPRKGSSGAEYVLEHVPGILHMMQFAHIEKNGPQQTKTTFLVTEGTFAKETIRFLKQKLDPSYKKQLALKAKGQQYLDEYISNAKRMLLAQRRKNALR